MKILGSALILLSALCGFLRFRRQTLLVIRLKRNLVSDLAVLKSGICIYRKTLPAICTIDLGSGLGSQYLWTPLGQLLAAGHMPMQECWSTAISFLPNGLNMRLDSLGALLGGGGNTLACAIDEVREELLSDIRAEERKMSASMRLVGAVCFSGACLLILVLV